MAKFDAVGQFIATDQASAKNRMNYEQTLEQVRKYVSGELSLMEAGKPATKLPADEAIRLIAALVRVDPSASKELIGNETFKKIVERVRKDLWPEQEQLVNNPTNEQLVDYIQIPATEIAQSWIHAGWAIAREITKSEG